uniref:G-protein coupled receptors family 1 profile domain-containing protein n=1 Tax=Eptatretus burgeri TaxID=7764 RepID=A0A8C4PZT2_EPTBU
HPKFLFTSLRPFYFLDLFVFWVFTIIMCISIILNFGVIMACLCNRFNSPMLLYIALSSLTDTCLGIVGVSCYLSAIIGLRHVISFSECLFQMFCLYSASFQQFLTTWLMYVDRHWAIFWPYSYVALIANKGGAVKLAIVVWSFGVLVSISFPCGCNSIGILILYCYIWIQISACGNAYFSIIYSITAAYVVYGLTGLTALVSTWCIVQKCRKSSTEANMKALHTCFTQLFASVAQFIALFLMGGLKRFVHLPGASFIMDLISVVTPAAVNPLIFGFRIQEILIIHMAKNSSQSDKWWERKI